MTAITLNYSMSNAMTFERCVELVNEGNAERNEDGENFTAAQLAGQYAAQAAIEAGYEIDEYTISGRLEFLREAGCEFSESEAVARGMAIISDSIGSVIAAPGCRVSDEEKSKCMDDARELLGVHLCNWIGA